MTTHDIVLSHGESNEGTAFPFWGIAVNGFSGNRTGELLLAGIWFNRADAQTHFENKRHRYPKSAYVYCFSAHASSHMKEIYENARAEKAARETTGATKDEQ